jgi:hypothetical protein
VVLLGLPAGNAANSEFAFELPKPGFWIVWPKVVDLECHVGDCVLLFAVLRIHIHFCWLDLDPDLHWEYRSGSALEIRIWIRIRAKMTHKSLENSSFEVLDVLV